MVVGSLSEFNTEKGINDAKYSSFELFRRNLSNPEIITFDELYERARFIVASSDSALNDLPQDNNKELKEDESIDNLPF